MSDKSDLDLRREKRRKRKPVREALKQVNRYYEGCQGVITGTEGAYGLVIDRDWPKDMRVALSLADKLSDCSLEYRFDIEEETSRRIIKVEFPPYDGGEFSGLM